MKNIIIGGFLITTFFLTGCSDNEPLPEKEVEEKEISSDPFLNFSVEKITANTKNEEIINGVKSITETYKDKVINIRVNAEEKRNTIIDRTEEEIEDNQTELDNQRDLYSQQCIDIQNEKQAEVCKDIDERVEKAIENIQELKETEKTTIDNINIEEIKQLSEVKKEFSKNFNEFENEKNIDLPNPF